MAFKSVPLLFIPFTRFAIHFPRTLASREVLTYTQSLFSTTRRTYKRANGGDLLNVHRAPVPAREGKPSLHLLPFARELSARAPGSDARRCLQSSARFPFAPTHASIFLSQCPQIRLQGADLPNARREERSDAPVANDASV